MKTHRLTLAILFTSSALLVLLMLVTTQSSQAQQVSKSSNQISALLSHPNRIGLQQTSSYPAARSSHAMAYDSKRSVIVLFGGSTNAGLSNETWEWNGTDWIQRFPANSPPARTSHGMAYDSARGVTVLFGGQKDSGTSNHFDDTWEWDGVNWTKLAPANHPLERRRPAMTYDSSRRIILLFGGGDDIGDFNDTWEWNGTNWIQRTPTNRPPKRFAADLVYDSSRNVSVLFGGENVGTFYNDTWEWDGNNWLKRSPVNSPPKRKRHAMVYDPARNIITLFGGMPTSENAGVYFDDTWEWDGNNWTKRTPVIQPSARHSSDMIYDSARSVVILFGGNGGTHFNDMWKWDGENWVQFTYTISGRITTNSGTPIPDVTISDVAGHTGTTNSNGDYTLNELPAGSYTLTPRKSGFSFSPPSLPVQIPPNAVEKNFVGGPTPGVTPTPPMNDPLFPQQWYLRQIKISDAWSRTQGSNNIVIAVIDSGVDYNHIDLAGGKTLTDTDQDFVNKDNNAMDDHGHGTHVAGIIAANTNNNAFIAGICPQCRILPIKVLNKKNQLVHPEEDLARAIDYAVANNARIINLSISNSTCYPKVAEAINRAYDKNRVIIAAAGNDAMCPVEAALRKVNFDVVYPARFERVIAVGASDKLDQRASFSNYGPNLELDIVAPGVEILSTWLRSTKGYSIQKGTSQAAPMVSGVAGLLLSENPSLTPAQVQRILESSADNLGPLGKDIETGWGRLNAAKALGVIIGPVDGAPPASCPPIPIAGPTPGSPITVQSHEDDLISLYLQLRDDVLAPSQVGQRYIADFYEYGPELAIILLEDSNLRTRTAQFLDHVAPAFRSLLPHSTNEVVLTQALYDETDSLVRDLAYASGSELHNKMLQTWEDMAMNEHIGETANEIWEDMQLSSNNIYIPIITKNK